MQYLVMKINNFYVCHIFLIRNRFIHVFIGCDAIPEVLESLVLGDTIKIRGVADFLNEVILEHFFIGADGLDEYQID
jgi:hypothetical protein